MAVPLAESILKVAQEGLNLWKTFIATRQEAYSRKQDKKQVVAIEAGEKLIFEVDQLIERVKMNEEMSKDKTIKGILNQVAHFRARFFKYN
jgi:hypothetical protein